MNNKPTYTLFMDEPALNVAVPYTDSEMNDMVKRYLYMPILRKPYFNETPLGFRHYENGIIIFNDWAICNAVKVRVHKVVDYICDSFEHFVDDADNTIDVTCNWIKYKFFGMKSGGSEWVRRLLKK